MSDNKKNVDLNKVSYNFGTKGWTVIGFEIVMLFFMTGITVDGLNTIVPMMAEYHSWNPMFCYLFQHQHPLSHCLLVYCGLHLLKRQVLKDNYHYNGTAGISDRLR